MKSIYKTEESTVFIHSCKKKKNVIAYTKRQHSVVLCLNSNSLVF